jgi:hypothetical protein
LRFSRSANAAAHDSLRLLPRALQTRQLMTVVPQASRADVVEAYIATGRNAEHALNLLFDSH